MTARNGERHRVRTHARDDALVFPDDQVTLRCRFGFNEKVGVENFEARVFRVSRNEHRVEQVEKFGDIFCGGTFNLHGRSAKIELSEEGVLSNIVRYR